MTWFSNLKTRSKIMCLVAILLILLCAVGVLAFTSISRINKQMISLYEDYAMPMFWMSDAES
jgi:hypothetical protein